MRIEYVLLPKNSDNTKPLEVKTIKGMLNDCFNNVTSKTFMVKPAKAEYKINYSISYSKCQNVDSAEKVFSLIFEFDYSRKDRTTEILNFVHHQFNDCPKLDDHLLILAFDEVSEYYCNKCYPSFQRFERLIRQLIFKIMTKAFGALWVDETISNEIKNKLKEMI